jgi:transposase-like protein
MAKQHTITPDVREQIIRRVEVDGVSVTQAAKEHGVSDRVIYKWLGKSADKPTQAEVTKLKRENKALLELVGEMTLKMSETQKKS